MDAALGATLACRQGAVTPLTTLARPPGGGATVVAKRHTATNAAPSTIHLTYRYRLLPTKGQHRRLRAALDHSRDLYNAALEHRISAYRKAGKTVRYMDHCKALTELRTDSEWAAYPVSLQRWPLKQLDLAFAAFFRRLKAGEQPGFPRFKGRDRWKTFGFTDRDGWKLDSAGLRMRGIGAIRIHLHRSIPAQPIALKVKRDGANWYALLTVPVECAEDRLEPVVGLDVGVAHLATLSTNEHIANPRHATRMQRRTRRAARALSRCKRGSHNRRKAKERLARLRRQEANARATYLHQVSADLAGRFGVIAVEALNLKGMTRSGQGKTGLNRSLQDASFGRLKEFIRYKVEKTGGRMIEVNPRYTSQTCSACGTVDAASRRSQSLFRCTGCGHEANADVNAALNIARRGGVLVPGDLNLGSSGMVAESSAKRLETAPCPTCCRRGS